MKPLTNSLSHSSIFPRQTALLPVLLLAVTAVCAADKPWKSKPFKEWNDKEVQTILTDSPWVRTTMIQRTWIVSEKDVAPDPQINGGVRTLPAGAGQPGSVGGGGTAPIRSGEGSLQELNVYIYWQSSRVMRAATARQAVLHGENVDPEKYAGEPQNEYQIILRMEDMTPFAQHNEEFFQNAAFLQMKKGKSKISPSKVVFERNARGSIQDAIFFFPKTNPISGDETDVQFSCKIADSTVRADFKPRDMVDQSGPAL